MVTSTTTVRFDISGASAPGAPAWASQISDAVWGAIANGSSSSGNLGGSNIRQSLPNPVPSIPGFGQPDTLANVWTGAYYDEDNGEYGFLANGGHADYPGNECYALKVKVDTPYWRRVADPTPNSVMQGANFTLENQTWPDGRSRAMHNCFQTWGDGLVIMNAQNSVTSGGGGTETNGCYWNRGALGAALTSVPWTNDSGQWTILGQIPVVIDGNTVKFGTSCWDRTNRIAWGCGGGGFNAQNLFGISTNPATRGQQQAFLYGGNGFGNICALTCAYDLNILIGFCALSNRFGYIDLANRSAGWTIPTNITGTLPTLAAIGSYSTTTQAVGAVYYQKQKSVILCDPPRLGKTIYRLQIPTTSGGAFNPAGQWNYTQATPSGPAFTIGGGNNIVFTHLQLCPDIGNGQACLIYCGSIDGPSAVYKIPASGFPF